MKKIQHVYPVIGQQRVGGNFYRLTLKAPDLARRVRPGQFIHIRVTDGLKPFFRRPFSVFRAKKNLEILYEVVGPGTKILSQKKKGDRLDVLGPLGNAFVLPDKKIKQVVMIAGGIGLAPFMILTDVLKKKRVEKILLFGARSRPAVLPLKEFKANGCRVFVSTDDGSQGVKGRVSALYPKINPGSDTAMIYACGPKAMLADVKRYARKHRLKAQASCEEVMACGLGACLGCVIQTTQGYKTVCHDGPVFDLDEIIFS